jgi:hypothetical protein
MKVAMSAPGSRIPDTTARPRIWFSKFTRGPNSFLLDDSRTDGVRGKRPHVHGLDNASASQMRQFLVLAEAEAAKPPANVHGRAPPGFAG